MGLFSRISNATRAGLSDLRSRTMGISDKPLSELNDAELEEELLRRRRARASGRQEKRPFESPRDKQIAQYYANLELEPRASADDVRKAYRRLMRKYHPDRHQGDPERHRAATELTSELSRAYRAILEHLGEE